MPSRTQQTYNGWANRATWNVHLWLTNEWGLYYTARRISLGTPITEVAEALREFCHGVWPSGMTPDGDRLSECRWRDVARALRE